MYAVILNGPVDKGQSLEASYSGLYDLQFSRNSTGVHYRIRTLGTEARESLGKRFRKAVHDLLGVEDTAQRFPSQVFLREGTIFAKDIKEWPAKIRVGIGETRREYAEVELLNPDNTVRAKTRITLPDTL